MLLLPCFYQLRQDEALELATTHDAGGFAGLRGDRVVIKERTWYRAIKKARACLDNWLWVPRSEVAEGFSFAETIGIRIFASCGELFWRYMSAARS